jgi:[ribosomal protein S18]-alanine N-acetyltransferase
MLNPIKRTPPHHHYAMDFELTVKMMEDMDLDEVVALELTCSSDPWSRNMFLEEMVNPLSHCFVTRRTDQHFAVGFVCFRNIGEESDLLKICVHPHHRQEGIGKRMMEFYIDFCLQRDVKQFYLEVNSLNQPAIHLYRLFFYRVVGVRTKFYESKFDALLMLKEERNS